MELSFSQRIGKKPVRDTFQLDSMDIALRNGLWNKCLPYIMVSVEIDFSPKYYMLEHINTNFFKERSSVIRSHNCASYANAYYKFFVEADWYLVYDLIEFIINNTTDFHDRKGLCKAINEILEREMSGYRIIDNLVSPIIENSEINEIETAAKNDVVAKHITTALALLSDRTNPDYRNSIKESISAVEAICRKLSGKSTLGAALNHMKSAKIVDIDTTLLSGMEKLYSYTNDEATGIRHAIIEGGKNVDFFDAKYMLVICSAFVNYITSKAN